MNLYLFCNRLGVVALALWIATWSIPTRAHAEVAQAFDISLPLTDGTAVRLHSSAEYRLQVICFLGCDCPLAKLYADRLNQLATEFADQDVRFVGINSNPQDTMEEVAAFAKEHNVNFPMAKDHDATALMTFGASRTPEVIVIDPLGQVVYQGRIDDQYRPGVLQSKPTRHDLREAIEESLADRTIAIPCTEAAGCLIAKPRKVNPDSDVTYCGQIASILTRHCVECHREGEIGPFALTSFEEASGWADMMLETIEQKRMPPWHATSQHEPLLNERRMSEEDVELIRRWIASGTPFGDASKLPKPLVYNSGWQLSREPDVLFNVSTSPFRVAGEGVIEYQYFVVDTQFENDVWVESAEIIPGNRSVLHHAIAFIRPPDGTDLDGMAMLAGYVPGQRIPAPAPGLAKRIPAGSKIVFQMHYTPTGTEQFDQSKLGLLVVDKESVTHESMTVIGINHGLEIPPHEANVRVEGASTRFPENGELLAVAPHMHLRGKSFSVQLNSSNPSDSTRTILEVPEYDFNWQHTYLFRDPIKLKDVESISFCATFDNSSANPFNPDPTQFVTWGDQTWEEMAVVFYEIARPTEKSKPKARLVSAKWSKTDRATQDSAQESARREHYETLAKQLMVDLDRNGDGVVEYDELDLSVKWRLFRKLDLNDDRRIDHSEALRYVQQTSPSLP
jgi:peroxiredoxin